MERPEDGVELQSISTGLQLPQRPPAPHRVLLVLDETDIAADAMPQLNFLATCAAAWRASRIAIKVYCFVHPIAFIWRYLQRSESSAAQRGAKARMMLDRCIEAKRICTEVIPIRIGKEIEVEADVVVDSTCPLSETESIDWMITSFNPTLVLLCERSTNSSWLRTIQRTSQEYCVSQVKLRADMVICRTIVSFEDQHTIMCVIDPNAFFYSGLPAAVELGLRMAKPGDLLILYATYSNPGVGIAMATTDFEWDQRIKDTIKHTKERLTELSVEVQSRKSDVLTHCISTEMDIVTGVRKLAAECFVKSVVLEYDARSWIGAMLARSESELVGVRVPGVNVICCAKR